MDSFLDNKELVESSVDSDGTWNPMGIISIDDSKDENKNSSIIENSINQLSSYTDPHNVNNPTLSIDIKSADDIIKKFSNMFKKQVEESPTRKTMKIPDTYIKPTKEEYGLNISKLKKWNKKKIQKKTEEDEARQEIALYKVKQFMDAIFLIIKLQSWWRMKSEVMKYEVWRAERRKIKRLYYAAWKRQVKAEKSYKYQVLGKPFEAWATEVQDSKNLRVLVRDFFLLCIKRLRLTPQAVMAYFSPQEWGDAISEGDQNKIRRLVLSKLFTGWRSEIRFLRNSRFRASQILTRVMRRSKGPMWVKETTLVCFHVWRRYSAVRKAYKLQLPEPRFSAPYLPQWTKLLQTITLQRIAKKRAAEKGEMLVYSRNFRKWTFVMTVDRTQSANPEAIAESHNRRVMLRRVVLAWQSILRERGSIVRVRDRCFNKWKKWAPTRHRMTALKKATKTWLDARRTYNAFYAMQVQCFELISRVISKVKLLRSKCLDRKVIMCAYGLLNRDACVIALDCWRRWKLYWQGRVRWRKASLQYNYMWHSTRIKVLFQSWKYFVDNKMGNSRPSTRQLKERNKRISMMSIGIESYDYNDDSKDAITVDISPMDKFDESSLERDSIVTAGNSNTNRSNAGSPASSTTRIALQIDDDVPLIPGIGQLAYNNFENVRTIVVTDPKLPLRKMYHLFYHCLARAHNRQAKLRKENVSNDNIISDTDELKMAIDRLDIDGAMQLVEKGSVVESSHIQQVAKYLGDEYIPLFCYLISKCPSYMAERITKADRSSELNHCSNPINALALASHIKRWEKCQLSRRELTIFEDTNMNEELCGSYNSVILWRSAVMSLLRKRADDIQSTCVILPESRSVDTEVVEAMKRKKLLRMRQVRESVRGILNLREDRGTQLLNEIPLLVLTGPEVKQQVPIDESILGLDINSLLHEYAEMKGKLSEEVSALRTPLVLRDDKLIENGKLKQARADFLLLRRSCMSKEEILKEQQKIDLKKHKQRTAEREKQYKEAMVRKKSKSDADKKAKKAARAAAVAKKKADKARKRAGLSPTKEEEFVEKKVDESKDKMDDIIATLLADEYDSEEDEAIIALHQLQEEEDMQREELFQSRTSHIGQFIFETWISPTKRDNEENLKILCERANTEAKDAFNRLLRILREGGIHITKNQRAIDGHGGIGGWLVSASFNHPKIMTESVFKGLVPLSWWNLMTLFERTKKEITLVEAYMLILEAKFEKNYKEDSAIDAENSKLKAFLASTREDVLKVAKRKTKKIDEEKAERIKKGRSLEKLQQQIDDINKRIKSNNEKVKKADIMLATSNIDGVYHVFNVEPITVNNDDDKERLRFTAYELVEKNRDMIHEFDQRIKETNEDIARVKLELYSFDSFCERGTSLLRDLAESRFSTMLEVQQLVNRSSKRQYTLRADSTIEFKFLTKIKKYLGILNGFLGIVNQYQHRAQQQTVEEKSESLVFDSIDHMQSVEDTLSSENSVHDNGEHNRHSNSMNDDNERNKYPSIIIDEESVLSRGRSDSMNMNNDIENLWLGIGQFMGPRPNSPPKFHDGDEDDGDEGDDHFEDSISIGGHSNSTVTVITSVKRRLSKLEQFELEQQMVTIAAEKADVAETNEMRAQTFDEYWVAVIPQKKKKKEKLDKKKKKEEQQQATETKEEPESTSSADLEVIGKTSNLWKSVGKTYRRDRKERILTELDPDSCWNNDEAAKAMYKTRLIPADMNYDAPVWKVFYNHKTSISMSATEHPDLEEEQSKKSGKKYSSRSQKNVATKDPFAVMGMNEYERIKSSYDKFEDASQGSCTKSTESFYQREKPLPQYDDTESEDSDEEKIEENDAIDNDVDGNIVQQTLVVDHDDNDDNQLESIFADSANNLPFSDSLNAVEVKSSAKSSEIQYPASASSSPASAVALVSTPPLTEIQSKTLVSNPPSVEMQFQIPVQSKEKLQLPDTIDASAHNNISIPVNVSTVNDNVNIEIASSRNDIGADISTSNFDTNDKIRINDTKETNVIIPVTTANPNLGSDSHIYDNINNRNDVINERNDVINESDIEFRTSMRVDHDANIITLETLPEKVVLETELNNSDVKIRKQDLDSDSDISDDEQTIPIPISYVSVAQVSGEIMATKGGPSINLSTFSVEISSDSAKRAVKFDQSIDKPASVSSIERPAEMSKDEIKWHMAGQHKAKMAKPEDILVLGSSLFETSLEDAPVVIQERAMTPGGSLSERLGLTSSASPARSEEPLLPCTPGGSLLSQIEQRVKQISEGSLRASQEILDKISMHDDNDDDDDNYVSFTFNDLDKEPIALEGAFSRPATQYSKAITLDLNRVADAIDQLKHEYHDDPPSFVNKPVSFTNKVEIAQTIRNAKAKKMTLPDKRSNPKYIKLDGYNITNDFSADRDGAVIAAEYNKKIKVSKFKKNKEDAEQAKRVQDLKYNTLLGHSYSQPQLGDKNDFNRNTNSNSTSNIDIYDMRTKAPDAYVNQLLYNSDDDVLKLAYSVVLGLDRKLDVDKSDSPRFAEGLIKGPSELEILHVEASPSKDEPNQLDLNDSLASSLVETISRPPDLSDDIFDYRSSLKTPIISLRDYAVSRQGSRGQSREEIVAPPFIASTSSLPSSPNYDRYLLKSRQTPLSLEPLKPQALIPLTFGIDDEDEANLENELRALLRNNSVKTTTNADVADHNHTNIKSSNSVLPPLKENKPKSNLRNAANGRVKITKGTLLRSLSLASPRIGVDSNMMVNGAVPKVKKSSTYVYNTENNPVKPQLQSLSVSSSVDSKLSKKIRSDITIATINSHSISHSFSDVLDDMSARTNSETKDVQKKKKKKKTKKTDNNEKNDNNNEIQII